MNQPPKLQPTTTQQLVVGGAAPVAMSIPGVSPSIAIDLSQHQKRDDPLRPQKVAIIGTAPSSRALAPYMDPSWTIWGTSPGNAGDPGAGNASALPRVADAWIEMHANFLWPEYRHLYGEAYVKWLMEKTIPVLAPIDIPVYKEIFPRATLFPWQDLVREFGPYFFTSTFAWAMAFAIKQGAKEIGLFGIDMSSQGEYIAQRPGGHYFILKAEERGIKLNIPNESDLLQPPPLYGIHDSTPMGRKQASRRQEIVGRIAGCDQRIMQAQGEKNYLSGALEDNDYYQNVWGGHSTRQIIDNLIDKIAAA
jgi:hypothetical protein